MPPYLVVFGHYWPLPGQVTLRYQKQQILNIKKTETNGNI